MGADPDREPPRWAVYVARAVAVVIVVPIELLRQGLKAVGRVLVRFWRAVGRMLRFVLRPVLRAWAWLGPRVRRFVLAPLAKGLGWAARMVGAGLRGVGWLLERILVRPAAWVWRTVLRPCGRAVGWLLARLRRFVLAPLGKGLGRVLRLIGKGLYRLAGRVLSAVRVFWLAGEWAAERVALPLWRMLVTLVTPVGRAIGWGWRAIMVRPGRWVRESVITPVRVAGRRIRRQIGRAFRIGSAHGDVE